MIRIKKIGSPCPTAPASTPPGTNGGPHTVTPTRGRLRPHAPELDERRTAPPIDPPDLSQDLVYLRERSYALYRTRRFELWLLMLAASERVPLPKVETLLYCLVARVQLQLLAPILWPQFYAAPLEPDDQDTPPETYIAIRHESEAAAHGMTVRRVRRTTRPIPSLPGCQGRDAAGKACANLRAYGERFCPSCRRAEIERLRKKQNE